MPADEKRDPKPGEWFCGDCDRVTDDPLELDLELCLKCGERLSYEMDELPNCVWKGAFTPFAENN